MAMTTVDNRRETVSLIGSDKVDGTPVYGMDDRKIGTVQRVMLDKISGKVAYAVVSFGGFLGMGDKLFAVPWAALKPTADRKAFTLDLPKERLQKAPGFDKSNWPDQMRERMAQFESRAVWEFMRRVFASGSHGRQ